MGNEIKKNDVVELDVMVIDIIEGIATIAWQDSNVEVVTTTVPL